MTDAEPSSRPTRQPGRIDKAFMRLFMRQGRIAANEPLGGHFRLIRIEGPDLKDVKWSPGDKVQIALGSAFLARTYTPIEWDSDAGATRIVAYAHGAGPGSDWLRAATPGESCTFLGPRTSLRMSDLSGPLVIFGDETSFGLAMAAATLVSDTPPRCLFEVRSEAEARSVLGSLGLSHAEVFERGDGHLERIRGAIAESMLEGRSIVLTGDARSIQHLRQGMRPLGVPSGRVKTKAYWAPGKTGLD